MRDIQNKIQMIVDKDIETEKDIHIYKIENNYSLIDKSNGLHTKNNYTEVYKIAHNIILVNDTNGIIYNTVSKKVYKKEETDKSKLITNLIAQDLLNNLKIYLDYFKEFNNSLGLININCEFNNIYLKKDRNIISLDIYGRYIPGNIITANLVNSLNLETTLINYNTVKNEFSNKG